MSKTLYDIPVNRIDGTPAALGDFKGDVLLIVNVASACGLTPQYTALEKTYETYRDRGFKVLGFPANDFGAQEPGTNEEIKTFCSTKYAVEFPLFAKISVKGPTRHPLYGALIESYPRATFKDNTFVERLAGYGIKAENETDVTWNFEKFLIGRDGRVVGRFAPDISPDDPLITSAIEAALAQK